MRNFVFSILIFNISIFSNPFYHWPVQGTKLITGTFGEFRRYSFHMGTDFATEGKEGVPILALTQGRVIRLQSYRYSIGNAVWLEHEDGLVSRYGHLQRFSEKILNSISSEVIKKKIFFRQDFEYIFPIESQPSFLRGEILGYSGKTGLGPPHLHVDLFHKDNYYNLLDFLDTSFLDTSTQILVDYLELIPLNEESFINGKNQPFRITFSSEYSDFYTYVERVPIFLKGKIGVKLASSELTKSGNRLGLRNISLKVNDVLFYEIDFSKIYRPHTIQSCLVYDNYKSSMDGKPFLYYLYNRVDSQLENLRFPKKENGVLNLEKFLENENYLVQIQITGVTKKKVTLSFRFKKDVNIYSKSQNIPLTYNVFPNKETKISSEDKKVELSFTKDSIFIENYFSLFVNKSIHFTHPELIYLSEIYTVLPDYREFNQGYSLNFYFDEKQFLNPLKTGLFLLNSNGVPIKLISKTWKNSMFSVTLRYTGSFAIIEDNSPPKVWVVNLKPNMKYKSNISILLKAEDLGSGLDEGSVFGKIDGEPAFFDYDPDLNTWELFYSEIYKKEGTHILEYWAKDIFGNESRKEIFEYSIE